MATTRQPAGAIRMSIRDSEDGTLPPGRSRCPSCDGFGFRQTTSARWTACGDCKTSGLEPAA